ncbi:ABC transporter ATP-binding protein [Cryobacterium sp. PH31-O1]|uniref:ATP-binding cassette domain-containing protein n=1 Tax=Cryobacterium sp. PH31-O1 TaxID=3046306 RepID=UPI0024BB2DEB|nr:ABC transporter ATP-binding protein [Cryobacterium sp. PH31-O1]MDJ0337859.1 ABC transporter ATP-binding protein [Cryobacterium sp. PH31-O1]
MNFALTVHDLAISVKARRLVHDLSLTVAAGERVALLGASGSGKSITAAAILGSLGPEFRAEGSISVFGTPLRGPASRRSHGAVAAIDQDSAAALNPLVTIGAQLAVPVARHTGRKAVRGLVADLLDSVGIENPARTMAGYAAELSGGQRQRVCIALALACRARLLIADEPTTALDVVNQARVLEVLRFAGHAEPAAILFITHDLAAAAALCDRAVVLDGGRVVEQAMMADLIQDPQHPYSRALVEAAQPARHLASVA